MRVNIFIGVALCFLCSCSNKAIIKQRKEKYERSKIELSQQEKSIAYHDQLLSGLYIKADSLLPYFKYLKDEKYDNVGFYTHKTLLTGYNYMRNFVQVRLTDNYDLLLKAYYIGNYPINIEKLKISDGSTYLDCEGTLHSFREEDYHEIFSLGKDNAIQFLQFLENHISECVYVELKGQKRRCKFYLNLQDKDALLSSYQLYVVMQDIHDLEREREKSIKLIDLYRKRLYKDSVSLFKQ